MPTYPPPPPTVSGSTTTINNFLNNPAAVTMRVRELTQLRYLSDFLLTGRTQTTSGSIRVDVNEPLFLGFDPRAVNPGAEYPRATETRPTTTIASITKWGLELPITDEAIGREGVGTVDRVTRKLANNSIRTVDQVALAVIAAGVTQTQAAAAVWSAAGADHFLDIMLAKAKVDELNEGFDVDTCVLTPTLFARVMAGSRATLPREGNSVVTTGTLPQFAGVTFVTSTNLPTTGQAFLCDRTMLGGMAYEDIPSPEWNGSAATGPQARARRDMTGNDQWLLGTRRPVVPYIVEPKAGIFITGVV